MDYMRLAARTDSNQSDIVQAMRDLGATVTSMHQLGKGIADLLVSWRQQWFVMEVKASAKEKLTEDQIDWIGKQRAAVVIITSPDEAVRFLQAVRP
jgi:hypothetical protein